MLLTLAHPSDTLTTWRQESSERKYEAQEVKHTTQQPFLTFQEFDVIPLPIVRTTPMNSDIS